MSKVKSRHTDIELKLRKKLWNLGFKYKVKSKLFGNPDIVFYKQKVVIFCDGDFWHGKNYDKEKHRYKRFWVDKIATNIKRDHNVDKRLRKDGWKVLRFWKTDINKNLDKCLKKVVKYLQRI